MIYDPRNQPYRALVLSARLLPKKSAGVLIHRYDFPCSQSGCGVTVTVVLEHGYPVLKVQTKRTKLKLKSSKSLKVGWIFRGRVCAPIENALGDYLGLGQNVRTQTGLLLGYSIGVLFTWRILYVLSIQRYDIINACEILI